MRSKLLPSIAWVLTGALASAQTLLHDLPGGSLGPDSIDYDQDGFDDFVWSKRLLSGFDGTVLVDLSSYWRMAPVGDLAISSDGIPDFLVSELGITFQKPSSIHAISGLNEAIISSLAFGFTYQDANVVRGVGDVTGDGVGDALVAADGFEGCIGPTGTIAVFDVASFEFEPIFFDEPTQVDEPYYLTEPAGDVDGDGIGDIAISRGCDLKHDILFYSFAGGLPKKLFTHATTIDPNLPISYHFSAFGDWDGDQIDDFLLAEPTVQDPQEVRVVSGADRSTLHVFPGAANEIEGVGDVDCDGYPDFLAGKTASTHLISGRDGSELWSLPEEAFEMVALGDVDADGVRDFGLRLLGGAQVWSSPGPAVTTYCTGKITSAGCVPTMAATGTPAAQADDDFYVIAAPALAAKPGLFFWGTSGPAALPFLGGLLCSQPPLRRGPVLLSDPGADCASGYAFHFSQAYALSTGLVGGETVHGQFWMRDPEQGDGTGVGLSDAVQFSWCP